MEWPFMQKAIVGASGMAIGAAMVTLIRVAAVDGAETARARHIADIASGRVQTPRVVQRSDLRCPSVADGEVPGIN